MIDGIGTVYEHVICKCEFPIKHWCQEWGLICDCGGIVLEKMNSASLAQAAKDSEIPQNEK